MPPEVSVVVPAYKSRATIGEALRSVLAQTVQDFEVLVVVDASPDDTAAVARAVGDPRIRVLEHERNKGPAGARNTAMGAAEGRWLAFLDADDAWHPQRLERLLALARRHPGAFFGDDVYRCVPGKGGALVPIETVFTQHAFPFEGDVREATFADIVRYSLDVKPFLPAEPVRKHGLRQNEAAFGAEWLEFWGELFHLGYKLVVLREPLYYLRLHRGSLTTQPGEVRREIEACDRLAGKPWVDADAREALAARRKHLQRAYPWVALRKGQVGEGLAALARTPGSVPWLAGRLARLARRRLRASRPQGP